MIDSEAFVLLTLQNATLIASNTSQSGILSLICVAVQNLDVPQHPNVSSERDVYLMLRINALETPIDPAGKIDRSDASGVRTYVFHGTDLYPTDRTLHIVTTGLKDSSSLSEDLETFDSLLTQYGETSNVTVANSRPEQPPTAREASYPKNNTLIPDGHGDLRGQLVAVNEDTGEVIGQFDDRQFRIQEDPKLHQKGHENNVVYIDLPELGQGDEVTALQMFIGAIPEDQQDWITKSATLVSYGISSTASLLLTTITAASSYYIKHSTPSPYHPNVVSLSTAPPPLPPPALVFLTSEQTRKGLAGVHAMSSEAVKLSGKTVSIIDNMIRRAVGSRPKQPRRFLPPDSSSFAQLPPPPYPGRPGDSNLSLGEKPSLPPPSGSRSPVPPPLPFRSSPPDMTYDAQTPPLLPLRKRDRVILSLDLILSTLDHEARRLLNKSSETVGEVVQHKYGPQAAESSLFIAESAKNVGLVYVDMKGIGKRALLRKAGFEFVKGRVRSSRPQVQVQPQA